ncbi:MAG: imelysin family protein [Planctomycetota bacterium]
MASSATVCAQDTPTVTEEIRRAVVVDVARYAESAYSRALDSARALRAEVESFVDSPTEASLERCRRAWVAARQIYGETEVLRFSSGPIDDRRIGVETYLNAWPVDESYIDSVRGREGGGIVNDPENFPSLTTGLLTLANERGGEANVCIGWHAIEFLLWGQDFNADGPGGRTVDDFVDGRTENADRRRELLQVTTALLCEHLGFVLSTWNGENESEDYRTKYLALDPSEGVRRALRGMVCLSGFELAGERMAVAFETQDQEDEHSCFSDTTLNDLKANLRGIVQIYRGTGPGMTGHGLQTIARLVDPAGAKEIDRLMSEATVALDELPGRFDQLILAEEGSAQSAILEHVIELLEQQAEALAALGLTLGYEIPLVPSAGG